MSVYRGICLVTLRHGGQSGFLFLLTSAPSVCAGQQPSPKAKLNKARYRMRTCLIAFHGQTAERSNALAGLAVSRRETPARAIFPITVSWHHSPQAPARHCQEATAVSGIRANSERQKAVLVILVIVSVKEDIPPEEINGV